jgi:hypothetical protein
VIDYFFGVFIVILMATPLLADFCLILLAGYLVVLILRSVLLFFIIGALFSVCVIVFVSSIFIGIVVFLNSLVIISTCYPLFQKE